jgi:hypothetical protein
MALLGLLAGGVEETPAENSSSQDLYLLIDY